MRNQNPNIIYHAKKTLDNVWCGKTILGKLTNAEGYQVTCKDCLNVWNQKKTQNTGDPAN